MPAFSGKCEYLGPSGSPVQDGVVQVSFDTESLTLAGHGPSMAFDLGDIDVFESAEYELRLALYDGCTVRLKQFGKSFPDLARQLVEAYRDRLVRCLLVSDLAEVARFTGHVHLESPARRCDGPAEVRLFESNVAVLPNAAAGFQWRLAEVEAVEFDEHAYVVVLVRRGERLSIGRLAKRTGELAMSLRQQVGALQERSARVLRAVFPFLSSEEFRRMSTVMREGASTPIADLRSIHRLIEPSLLERVVDGVQRPYLRDLLAWGRPDAWQAGFKIVRPDTDAETEPDAEAVEDDPAGADAASMPVDKSPVADAVLDAGDGLQVLYWFLVPSSDGTRVAWEATSRGGRATYVFRLPPATSAAAVSQAIASLNDGLVALNFRREPVYLKADTLESDVRYRHYAIAVRKIPELGVVREAFVGRSIHRSRAAWRKQLEALQRG
jgi:hypothetical protein